MCGPLCQAQRLRSQRHRVSPLSPAGPKCRMASRSEQAMSALVGLWVQLALGINWILTELSLQSGQGLERTMHRPPGP